MEHEINILVVEPGKLPRLVRVDYSLETFSQLVGGELAKSLGNPLFQRFWIWWKMQVPANPNRRILSRSLQESIPRLSAMRR